jgi:heat shock protein beta
VALDDPEHPYIKFWESFGKSIKLGIMEDIPNKSKLAKLLRFKTSKSEGKWVSLDAYIENKPEWQKDIYFIAAESQEVCEKSPFMEMARRKDVEVLFLFDPVDEYTVQSLGDFDGLKLQSLTKEGLKFGDEDEDTLKKRSKLYREKFRPLTKYMKELYDGKVNKVTVSQRVESSPAIIVTSQYGHSANMERIARAQTFGNPEAFKMMLAQKTLELNPRHPMVVKLLEMAVEKPTSRKTKDMVWLLYDTALMASGFSHEDNDEFAERMYRTISHSINVEDEDLLDEIEIPREPEEDEEEQELAMDFDHDEF